MCCSYPILVLSNVYDSAAGEIVAMSGQVNIWIALAGSIIGCYIASTFIYRKFCVHDMVLASFSVIFILFREQLPLVRPQMSTITQEQPWLSELLQDLSALWARLN